MVHVRLPLDRTMAEARRLARLANGTDQNPRDIDYSPGQNV